MALSKAPLHPPCATSGTQKGPSSVPRRGASCRIFRSILPYRPHSEPERGRRGVGARHALFPRLTDIGRPMPPVECHRLPVPRRRARLRRTIRLLSGSAAEPADGVTTIGFSGETSWPDFRAPAGAPVSGPLDMTDPAEYGVCPPFGFSEVGIPPARDRLPRNTGLVSYPSRCVLHLRRTTPFPEPPAPSDLIDPARGHRLARRLPSSGLNPRWAAPFSSLPVATPGGLCGLLRLSSIGRGILSHHTGSQ